MEETSGGSVESGEKKKTTSKLAQQLRPIKLYSICFFEIEDKIYIKQMKTEKKCQSSSVFFPQNVFRIEEKTLSIYYYKSR